MNSNKNAKLVVAFFLFAIFVFGCSTKTLQSPAIDNDQTGWSPYEPPANYQAHRNQQRLFKTTGGFIAYTDHAPSAEHLDKTIVLIHGVPTSSWMYRKVIGSLSQQFRVISVDLLGYGSSSKPSFSRDHELSLTNADSAYSVDAQADYISDLLVSLDVNNYSLLFHDMGALVGWRLIARSIEDQNQNIKHAFVLNSIISHKGFEHPEMKKGFMARQFANAYVGRFSSAAMVNTTFKNMGLRSKELTAAECEGYVLPLKEGSDDALYSFFTGLDEGLFNHLNADIESLANFKGDVDVLWGKNDSVLTTQQLDTLKSALPASKLAIKILPDASHFVAEDSPEAILEMIGNRVSSL